MILHLLSQEHLEETISELDLVVDELERPEVVLIEQRSHTCQKRKRNYGEIHNPATESGTPDDLNMNKDKGASGKSAKQGEHSETQRVVKKQKTKPARGADSELNKDNVKQKTQAEGQDTNVEKDEGGEREVGGNQDVDKDEGNEVEEDKDRDESEDVEEDDDEFKVESEDTEEDEDEDKEQQSRGKWVIIKMFNDVSIIRGLPLRFV